MLPSQPVKSRVKFEFIVIVALLSSMVAMSIDTMLPALGDIATEFGVKNPNERQYILSAFFLGMTAGMIFYGPLSDSMGRRPIIFIGLSVYMVGSLLCIFSTSFEMILLGRLLQGLGAASPRSISLALVRDGQSGPAMARIMSFVMSVFMLVPILAPTIGQLILYQFDWRMIFVFLMMMGMVTGLMIFFRQPETLLPERRRSFNLKSLTQAAAEVLKTPISLGYTLASGFMFAAFTAYLGTSQQIFAEQYHQGDRFALWFGLLAIGIALAMVVNGRFVMRYGMRHLTKHAMRASIILSLIALPIALLYHGHPPLWTLGLYLFLTFFFSGMLFGNYNALAMEPMGHIAGMAAAISGTLSSLIAIVIGTYMGQLYNNTVIPLIAGYLVMGLAAWAVAEWAEKSRGKT